MSWVWTDHGNLDELPRLQLADGTPLHIVALPEVAMETLLMVAATPDLLQALRDVLDNVENGDLPSNRRAQAEAAMAKAEGKL